MNVTIYLPNEVGKWAKEQDLPLSRMLREAVKSEKRRREAHASVAAEGFTRVEVYDNERERDVAFQGRRIGSSYDFEADAYLSPKEAIAVYDAMEHTLYVYDTYAQLAEDKGVPQDLVAEVAEALGERYVEELDI